MVRYCSLFMSLVIGVFSVNAQTFSSNCGIAESIPDNSCGGSPLVHAIPVSGTAGTQLGVDIVLTSVSLVIQHSFDGDVEIYLESPGGVNVALSVANGSTGANYGDPLDVTCTSVTTFSRNGIDGAIASGAAPFIGNYIPQGNLDAFNDSTDPNGIWKLIVCDGFAGDTGTLQFVSLEFAEPCEQVMINTVSTTHNSAMIGWTSANAGAAYTLHYGVQGFTPPNGGGWIGDLTGASVSGNNTVTISGLSPFTTYDFYLSEDCGVLQSGMVGPFSFSTNKANDICSGAVPVSCGTVLTNATSSGATTTDAPALCGGTHNEAPGLWYVLTGNGMEITVSTCGLNDFDTRLGVFEGPCLDLTCVDGNEDFCGTQSQVTFTSATGTDYYIYVSGNTASSGAFELSVTCSANLVINEVDYAQTGVDSAEFIEILNAGSETVNLGGAQLLLVDGTGGGAVVYDTITLPAADLAAGDYFVICGNISQVGNCDLELVENEWLRDGSPDAIALSVAGNIVDIVSYNGTTGAPYTETSGVGLEDDSTASNIGIARIPNGTDTDQNNVDFSQRCISPGVSNISQNSNCTIPNDSCAHATVIQPALNIPFNNNGANTDGANNALCSNGGSDQIYSDLWYSFTPDCDGIATFSTVGGTAYDTRLAVYDGSCAGAIIECADDSSALIVQTIITWAVTSGNTYILRLGGFSSSAQDTGTFDLTLTEITPPVITCGADKFKNTDQGGCTAVANPAATTATDNCSDVTLVNDFNFTGDALDTYPLGVTAIVWTATDASGNTATCTQNVQITDAENPQITCPPDYTQLTDSGVCNAVVAVVNPLTSDNCTVASVINDFNGTPSATDTFGIGITTVVWTVSDNSGNTSTCAHTITISDAESPAITCPANQVIPNCDSVATIAIPINSDNCAVDSLFNDFNGAADASGTYPLGATTVTWTVLDVNGNSATCSMTVTRNDAPTASITPDPAETCVLTDLILYGNAVLDSGVTAVHSWTGPVVGATNRDSVVFNLGLAGVYGPLIYRVTDANGCSASDTITVNVFANPKATLIPDVIETCEGDTVSLNGNSSNGTPPYTAHLWTGDTTFLDVPTIPNPEFAALFAGTYNLVYTVTDSRNCMGSDNVTIIVNQSPAVNITPADPQVCQNAALALNANLVAGSGTIISRQWTGNVAPLSSTTAPVVNFNTSNAGVFNLVYTVTDNNVCTATDTTTVTVNGLPAVSFSGLQLVYCENETPDTLMGSPAGGMFSGPGMGGLSVTSDYTGGPDTILSSSLTVSTQTVSVPGTSLGADVVLKSICFEIKHEFVSDLDILLESPSGEQVLLASALCGNSDDLNVCIETGTFNSIDLASCSPTSPALSGTYTAFTGENLDQLNDSSSPNGNWNLVIFDNFAGNDGSVVNWSLNFEYPGINVFNPYSAGTGNHTITYTFVDGNGCTATQSQDVTVNAAPVADAGADATICTGDSIALIATGGTSYMWDDGATTASVTVGPVVNTTYHVTVSNAAGCSDADSVTVFVNSTPVVAFSGLDADYCLNGALDTLDATPDGGTFTGAGVSTVGGGVTSVNYTGGIIAIPSDTTVEAYDTVGGIIGSALGVDVLLESVCFNIQHTFVQDLVVTLTSPGGLSVTLTTQPCADNDDLDLCIVPGTGNSADTAMCDLLPPALSGTFTASSNANDDLAFINDGITNPNGVWTLAVTDLATGDDGTILDFSLSFRSFGVTTFNPTAAGAGAHTIVYSYTDANGCTGVDSATTNVIGAPPALAQPDTGICPGGTVTLTATGGVSYAWSTGSAADTTIVSPAITTTYTVSVTDSIGCLGTDDVTVTVFPDAAIDAGADTSVCFGASTLLTAAGGGSYVWSTGDSASFILVNPVVPTTYMVTATDTNGCVGVDSVAIDINPLPVAVPGPDADICFGDTATITATGGDFYYWSDGVITSIAGTRPALPLTTTVYTVIVQDSAGCADTASVTVNVHPIPNATINGLNSVYCNNNNPVALTGFPANGVFTGPALSGDTFSPALLAPGVYEIVYAYSDSFGCADTDTADVTIVNAPTVSFSGLAPEYCPDTVAHVLVGSPAGGVFSGPGIGGGTNTFVSFFADTGTHEIIYTYFAAGVCPGRDTQTVVVNELPDVRILGLDSTYCSADDPDTLGGFPAGGVFSGLAMNGNLFSPPQVVTGTPSVITYAYIDSNGCSGIATRVTMIYPNPQPVIVNPGNLCENDGVVLLEGAPDGGTFTGPGVTSDVLVTGVAGGGTHTIQYTYTDVHGCAGDTAIMITVYDVGTASFTGLDSVYCANAPVSVLTGTPAGGVYSGPGVGSNLFDPAFASTGGPYDIVYAYTDSNNCTVTDTQEVTVINSPFAQIGGLDSFYCSYESGASINLFPTGGVLTGAGISNGVFEPNAAGTGIHVISYKVTNPNGCSEIATELVVVDACVGVAPISTASVKVYPNPSEGYFVLEVKGAVEPQTVVRIYDVTGKVVAEERIADAVQEYRKEFDLTSFANGIYYLRINLNDTAVVKKLVIE